MQEALLTAKSFTEILEDVVKVSDIVSAIARSSHEQSEGISQVAQGISQIDQVTKQNTARSEEAAAAAEELSSQSDALQSYLAKFKVDNRHSISAKVTDISKMKNTTTKAKQRLKITNEDEITKIDLAA